MKKIITLLACIILVATTTFAGGEISRNAITTFSGTFAKATNVKWEANENYYTAFFQMNGQSLQALFSKEGELIAVSRNLLSVELPVNLLVSLNKNLSASWITELAEYTADNTTVYYVTIENADEKIILKSVGTYDWSWV